MCVAFRIPGAVLMPLPQLRAGVIVQPFINFFNLSTSHWEPLVDPWEFQLNIARSNQKWTASIESAKRLELNITATFINIAGATLSLWSNQGAAVLKTTRGSNAPFLIRNRTGHTIQLWSESQKSGDATTIASGKDVPWRFDDWRTMRENVMATTHNSLALTISDTAWEKVQNISIDQEGEHIHPLKPKLDNVTHRLCCDVQLTDNVKIITFRSTFKVENLTLVPVEMAVVKSSSSSEEVANSTKVFKIAPGQEGFVPIASAYEDRIRLRPDAGFKYAWSAHAYHWQELVKRPSRTIICHSSGKEDRQFFLQAYAEHDRADPMLKRYPRLTLKLRPPIELENCLPFNFNFRLYDKAKEHNYRSYVRKGGVSPLHVADLTHLTLLSVELEHRWFKQSEFAIVVTDNPGTCEGRRCVLLTAEQMTCPSSRPSSWRTKTACSYLCG
jgi:vacuolar protein sorting-associated protein 13A/C